MSGYGVEDVTDETERSAAKVQQIADIASRINRLKHRLGPITERINAGDRDPAVLKENNRLQAVISRLHEEREHLTKSRGEKLPRRSGAKFHKEIL